MKIRPTHPIFLEDVTVNRHIFLFGLTYDMLASFIGINATVDNISAMMYNMAVLLVFNDTFNIVTNWQIYMYI
jgi:ethanolamine ammonia-lyase large subunit